MTTKIHIVELGEPGNSYLKVVHDNELVAGKSRIKVRHYEDDGDSYYNEFVSATIKSSFLVMTQGQFIRNGNDTSKLNACTMSGGFGQINRLAYSYSVTVINSNSRGKIWESDLVYSDVGIRATNFDMYSYHFNEPEQRYDESRLDYEVFDSLNLTKILSKYLPKSDVRDSVIDDILK
jgi:hypothetical protein